MYLLMCYQSTLFTKSFITYCTDVRALTTVRALMSYQMALSTERFIT